MNFHIGQIVSYRPGWWAQNAPGGAYEVTRRMPQNDTGEYEYRIKHSSESHERIASERELAPVQAH